MLPVFKELSGTITILAVDNIIGRILLKLLHWMVALTSIAQQVPQHCNVYGSFSLNRCRVYRYRILQMQQMDVVQPVHQLLSQEPAAIGVTMNASPASIACTASALTSISVQSVTGGFNTFVRHQFFNNLVGYTGTRMVANITYDEANTLGGDYTIIVFFDDNGCQGTATVNFIATFDELLPATK
jgi:hypothetical protein